MPVTDPNYIRHLQYEANKRAKRKPTDEEERIKKYNKNAIQEITKLSELRRKRKIADATRKQEELLSDAAGHFIKRTADNLQDANKQMKKILKYHGVDR